MFLAFRLKMSVTSNLEYEPLSLTESMRERKTAWNQDNVDNLTLIRDSSRNEIN